MARGWESKSVEAQQDDAARGPQVRTTRTPEQLEADRQRQALQLNRKRALAELGRASAPAHRKMLEEAIASLDAQLGALDPSTSRS